MTTRGLSVPKWTQDQAIAYETALEAINDVIAGYSEQIEIADSRRAEWLGFRIDQARDVQRSLDVTDDANVQQVILEYGAIVRARDAAEQSG